MYHSTSPEMMAIKIICLISVMKLYNDICNNNSTRGNMKILSCSSQRLLSSCSSVGEQDVLELMIRWRLVSELCITSDSCYSQDLCYEAPP